jgi:hypothetical protein
MKFPYKLTYHKSIHGYIILCSIALISKNEKIYGVIKVKINPPMTFIVERCIEYSEQHTCYLVKNEFIRILISII